MSAARRVSLLILAALPAFGQQSPFVGRVQRVSGNEVVVLTPAEPVTIYTDEKTIIWKGVDARGVLREGDTVRVRCSRGFLGRFTATEIQTRSEVSGFVARVLGPGMFELTSAQGDNSRLVYLSRKTTSLFSDLPLSDGDHLLVIGWDVGNGRMEAIRVAVYDTDVPK